MKPIIDSHLDLAWNALSWKRDITLPVNELNAREVDMTDKRARGKATTSLPEMRRGGLAVCLGTLMARVPYGKQAMIYADTLDHPSHDIAHATAQGQLAYYRRLEARGEITLISTASDLTAHWQRWEEAGEGTADQLPIGIIVAMEGADPITCPEETELWYGKGLRCASLVHYGRSAYAAGTGEDGPVTPQGIEMLKQFERVGMILDVTHLSDTSFFQAMDAFGGTVLASHQNCRALVPGGRQFTDEQIKIVLDRGGILGIAFDAWMLYPGWVRGTTTQEGTSREVVSLDAAADHIDHICQIAGNVRQVAIGSDLDGGFGNEQTPSGLDTIADLQKLDAILSQRGYSEEDVRRIFHGNWLQFFRQQLAKTEEKTED